MTPAGGTYRRHRGASRLLLHVYSAMDNLAVMAEVSAASGGLPEACGAAELTHGSFQIRGRGRWTLDLLSAHRSRLRAFSGPTTFPTEGAAIRGCFAFGRRIIEGRVPNCSVDDLR